MGAMNTPPKPEAGQPKTPQDKAPATAAPVPAGIQGAKGAPQPKDVNSTDRGSNQLQSPAEKRGSAPKERRADRAELSKLNDRVAFKIGSSELIPGQLQKFIDQLSPAKQAALSNPNAIVFVTGLADRIGPAQKNLEISAGRAEVTAEGLRKLGVKAEIKTFYYGEQEARDKGERDGTGNSDFRSAKIDVFDGGLSDKKTDVTVKDQQITDTAKSITNNVKDLSKVDTIQEFKDRGKIVAKGAYDIAKDVADGKEITAAFKAEKALIGLWVEGHSHAEVRANVSLNLIPAYLQALDKQFPGPFQASSPEITRAPRNYPTQEKREAATAAAKMGVNSFAEGLRNMSPEQTKMIAKITGDYKTSIQFHHEVERMLHEKLNH